jgi:tripartite-type tricarboxylate transporter receptor subunit TctC
MRKVLCIAATLAVVAEPIAARPDWPSERPLKVIVPYTAGGPSDTVTRAIAKRLAERIGQNIVVENRPGANSALGIGQAAQMPADGYTFVTVLPAFLINSNLNKNIPYKLQDLAPVSLMADMPLFLFTNKDVPGQTIADMVKYFRSNPGKANYASSGEGSSAHLTGSYFALRNGLQMTHVPYKGASQFLPDLVSGQVSMVFDAMVLEMPYVKEGKLKALAIASRNRYPDAPDIPTMQESGYPGFIMGSWAGLMAPAGTPAAAIERMSREIAEIVKQPEVVATFKHLGFLPMGTSPQEFKSFLNDETERYAKILKDSNVKPE